MAIKNMFSLKLFVLTLYCLMTYTTAQPSSRPGEGLLERFTTSVSRGTECWNGLGELKNDCIAAISDFFSNEERGISCNCCIATYIVSNRCWPLNLNSLGFTPEEGTILSNYCTRNTACLRDQDSSSDLFNEFLRTSKIAEITNPKFCPNINTITHDHCWPPKHVSPNCTHVCAPAGDNVSSPHPSAN